MQAVKQKLFSVVIPTYNCGHKLAATIESVLSQPEDLYEMILVDGGSTDETLKVIEQYGRDFTLTCEGDQGVYDAFNKGISMSSGRYLLFLGAGDRVREGVLARAAEVLPEGKLSFAYGDAYFVRQDQCSTGPFDKRDFIGSNICQQAIFYERGIFDLLGGFDLKYKVGADRVFNMRCFADARVRKIYLGLVIADFEGGGLSDTHVDPVLNKDLPGLIRKYVGISEYLRSGIYLSRVTFYYLRHELADSIKANAQLPASWLRLQKPYDVVSRVLTRRP